MLYLPNGIEESVVSSQSSEYPIADPKPEAGNPCAFLAHHNSQLATRNSQLAIRNSQFTILFFTRFVEVEPQWLVNFWQTIHQHCPTARLLVAGDALQPGVAGIFQQQMQAQAAAARQVEWLGYVPRGQLEQIYSTVACAIFPAQEIPLLQAKCSVRLATTLLHGVPVVASAVGEQAAYGAEGAALLVEPAATPAQFAAAVLGVLQQPTQQRALVERARQRLIERYRWEQLGGQLEAFYQATLRRP
jgi:glycosyltransferase involved in cell wall biosynthesis